MSRFCRILQCMRKGSLMSDKKVNKKFDKCNKCGYIPAKIEYKDKKYCTWYCAKKGDK